MLIHLLQLGRVPYAEGLRLQAEVAAARRAGVVGDTLILLEHPPVLTLGRNASQANILLRPEELAARGVEVHEINRGGDVTYHGPGQLVGYPIFDLRGDLPGKRGPHLGPVDFVRRMEEALILSCKDFGVAAQRICKRTGVWTPAGGSVPEKKIAAIGIHVAQAITTHGFALNVTTDLRDFEWIIPCGITDRAVTSLEVEAPGPAPTMEEAAAAVSANFGRVFQRQMLAVRTLQELLRAASPSSRTAPQG
ncbi:MAG: lipoyl(octanoyl) transferase LipB [Acidobacteriota bacterium]